MILLAVASSIIFIGCSETEKPGGQVLPTGKIPDSILERATIKMTSGGMRKAIISADTLYVFEKEDSTVAARVKVDFYNETGEYQSSLTANRGLVRQKQESFSVWGDVVVKNDTSRLDTQSLHWDSKRGIIATDDFVRFQRRNDIISGYGMEADSKLENVKILRDVKGRIADIPTSEKAIDSLDNPKAIAPAENPAADTSSRSGKTP